MAGTAGELKVTGTVVSASPTTLVIRTEAGETMSFKVGVGTSVPTGLLGGDRVEVAYSSSATEGYLASHVMAFSSPASGQSSTSTMSSSTSPAPAATSSSESQATETSSRAADSSAQLPRTASPRTAIGLVGLATLAAGLLTWQARRGRPRSERGTQLH